MSKSNIVHDTYVIERSYPVAPARVFAAFADAEVKKRWPNHAVIASLMVDTRERWHEFVKRSEDAGADGIELNFGCPHGMCERGMGSAVGQRPEVAETIVGWVMEVAKIPVLTKLTPKQAQYLGIPTEGPYKPEHYRY